MPLERRARAPASTRQPRQALELQADDRVDNSILFVVFIVVIIIAAGRINDLRDSRDVQVVRFERDTQVAQVIPHVRLQYFIDVIGDGFFQVCLG
jgi:hypothetical protein